MNWNVWDDAFRDEEANMALYDLVGGGGLQVQENVIYFGTTEPVKIGTEEYLVESFLRPRMSTRHKDVDVTARIEIVKAAQRQGLDEDPALWFGIATRILRTRHYDAYLFYIRKDGRVEFGTQDNWIEKPPPVPVVASQAVTMRIKVEGDRVQTWVNNRPYHDWRDEQKEFIRKGEIYFISHATLVKIYSAEIKVKRWYAPLLKFVRRFWVFIVVLSVIVSLIAGLMFIAQTK